MGAVKQQRMLDAGARAPELKQMNLEEILRSGPVLLAFFKVACPVCQLTFPFLERLSRALKIFGVSQDDAEATREFNQEHGITFPALLDSEGEGFPASNAYGISRVPSLFLIEPDGKISWTLEGFSKKDLEQLGARVGVKPFKPGEDVPEWKAG